MSAPLLDSCGPEATRVRVIRPIATRLKIPTLMLGFFAMLLSSAFPVTAQTRTILDGPAGMRFVVVPADVPPGPFGELEPGLSVVTFGQWKTVMGTEEPHCGDRDDTFPASCISWEDAQLFIAKVNALADDGYVYRLPSTEEWDYLWVKNALGGAESMGQTWHQTEWVANTCETGTTQNVARGSSSCDIGDRTHLAQCLQKTTRELCHGFRVLRTRLKPSLTITKSHTGDIARGQTNVRYTITVSNGATAGPTSGTVTVTDTIPAGVSLLVMSGTGWTCDYNTCTRSDTLVPGASYPTVIALVNVAWDAPTPVVNHVSVSGGESDPASATDPAAIGAAIVPPTSATWVEGLNAKGLALGRPGHLVFTSGHGAYETTVAMGVATRVAGGSTQGFTGDGGPAIDAQLNSPIGVAVDGEGNIYIADSQNHRIRKVTAATGVITTVAGGGNGGLGDGGPATLGQLSRPQAVAVGPNGDLYIADYDNHRIRKVTAATGLIETVAGGGTGGLGDGGPATSAVLTYPRGVAVALNGDIYIADTTSSRIRKVTVATGLITTVAGGGNTGLGDGGPATLASLAYPTAVAVTLGGDLYIADTDNDRIRKVEAATGLISTVAGNGTVNWYAEGWPPTSVSVPKPSAVVVGSAETLYVADYYRIRRISTVVCPVRLETQTQNPLSSAGGSGSLTFTAYSAACSWTADSGVDWVTFAPGSEAGTGSGTVSYSVVANPYSAQRTGNIFVGGRTFVVGQYGVSCGFTPGAYDAAFSHVGGAGAATITSTAPDCSWSVTSAASWITIDSGGATVTGSGTVRYRLAANPGHQPRTGYLKIQGQLMFAITQAGAPCTVELGPATPAAFPLEGGNGTIAVTAPSDCSWSASSEDWWITITSGNPPPGSGTVAFSVEANRSALPRTGTLTIGGQTATTTQGGAPCTCQISPAQQEMPAAGGTGRVTFTVTPWDCPIAASSDASWLTITSNSSGPPWGSAGVLDYAVAPNGGTQARTGMLTLWGQNHTVAQAGEPAGENGRTWRVSVASDGTQANGASSGPSISADGRHVAFVTGAQNLVPADPWCQVGCPGPGIYVHDWQTGQTVPVVIDGINTGQAHSDSPSISGDGRFVAFRSGSSTLVPGDTNGKSDIFVHDRQAAQTTRISVATDGSEGDGDTFGPRISVDGRYVAFISNATNLVPGDTNRAADVFVRDRQTGQTTRAVLGNDGAYSWDDFRPPSISISGDGRYVAASRIGNGVQVFDRHTGQNSLISEQGLAASISTDGRFLAFTTTGQVTGMEPSQETVLLHDRQTGQTTRIYLGPVRTGWAWDGRPDLRLSLNEDGRHIAFEVDSSISDPDNPSGVLRQILLYDRQTGATTRLSTSPAGWYASGFSMSPTISGDGNFVAFVSNGTDLAAGDTNASSDVFLRDRQRAATCTYRLLPPQPVFSAAGGPGTVEVTAAGGIGCAWTAQSTVPWITVTDGGGGANDGTFRYDVAPTASSFSRTGTITLGGQEFTVTQTGVPCTFEFTPNPLVLTAAGGAGSVAVTAAAPDCSWSASPIGAWVVVTDGSPGTGSGTLSVLTASNPSLPREGWIRIGPSALRLTQADAAGQPPLTTRISLTSDGRQGNGGSNAPSISADGRYVAFMSAATDLVPGDANDHVDAFVRDRVTGLTTALTVGNTDGSPNSGADYVAISGNGRVAAFMHMNTQVLVRDLQAGRTLQTHDDRFVPANYPSISADGRLVAFCAMGDYLIPNHPDNSGDVFVYDRETGQTVWVSKSSDGELGNGGSCGPTISANGRFVAFTSSATNLVPGDVNGVGDVFVHDLQTGQTTRVTVAGDGSEANGESYYPAISADGRYIAFNSDATNLTPGTGGGYGRVYVHDRVSGQTRLVSVASDGTPAQGASYYPSISADGRLVTFHSQAVNLVPGKATSLWDVFVHDRLTGQTTRVSVASDGAEGNGGSGNAAISGDGRTIAFMSTATNLAPDDTNGAADIFVREYVIADLAPPTVSAITPTAGSILGGAVVTVFGNGFVAGATSVTIGGVAATAVVVTNGTWLTAVTPAGAAAGPTNVVVTTPGGSGALAGGFTYINTCTSFSIEPTSAPSATHLAGSATVAVTGGQDGCTGGSWTAAGNGSWLSVSPTSGSGSGSVTVSWTENASGAPRTGTATIAGSPFTVVQGSSQSSDSCSSATLVTPLPFTATQDTSAATTETGDPSPWAGAGAHSVWYRFTAPRNGRAVIDTLGSTYNTVLTVFTGTCGGWTQVAGNDDASGTLQSQLTLAAAGGTTYGVMVTSFDATGGQLTFNLGYTAPAATADFNGDGKPDILWRNGATGQNVIWLMDGTTKLSEVTLPAVPDTQWQIVAVADLNADSKPDILWRHAADGRNVVWFLDGTTFTSQGFLPPVADTAWRLAAVADFNADTTPDLVWRNGTTGQNVVWYLDGITVLSQALLAPVADTAWQLTGAADFNGDQAPDLLWRNGVTGLNVVWYMNGATYQSQVLLPPVADTAWHVGAVQDMNADGQVDLVWRNGTTGQNAVWFLNGVTLISEAALPPVGTPWDMPNPSPAPIPSPATPFDFDGNGYPDILWRHATTGQNVVWTMTNATVLSQTLLPLVADTAWQPVAVADLNADGDQDIVWRHAGTGMNVVWFMNGTTFVSQAMLPAVADTGWQIVGAADFNADTRPDLVWRHATSGQNVVWFLNGTTIMSQTLLPPVPDTAWEIVATVDFNGDRQPDLVWRNATTGMNLVWYMNGATFLLQELLPAVGDPAWRIGMAADFNRDGSPDLMWRNYTTGLNVVWYLNGVTFLSQALLPIVDDVHWFRGPKTGPVFVQGLAAGMRR